MKLLKLFSTAAILAMLLASPAFADEPRPWLCRDKPVFSYDRSMEYQVTARPGRQWRIFFMLYSPDAAHDGFDIVNSREVSSRGDPVGGNLAAGRYFSVALYREGGHWVCPHYTHDHREPKLRALSEICHGEGRPPRPVQHQVETD